MMTDKWGWQIWVDRDWVDLVHAGPLTHVGLPMELPRMSREEALELRDLLNETLED